MRRKVHATAVEALGGLLFDGMTIMSGGLGTQGVPETLIAAIRESGVKGLTIISNNGGLDGFGLGTLLAAGQIKKLICSYVGDNRLLETLYFAGELEVEFTPQGSLAERIRAGGAGVPAFFTRTGVGTPAAAGKEVREFDGALHVMERSLTADLAVIKAWKGDAEGDLAYRQAAGNFNPVMAAAGRVTVAEVEELVEVGALGPDRIHTPGIYVDRIIKAAAPEARVEPAARPPRATAGAGRSRQGWTRDEMAARAAAELRDGAYVNLGVGLPTLVADHIPRGMSVTLQTANSLGSSYFNSADGFAMIRGGHVDLCILGGLQVAANGDLANWMAPGKSVKGMGGAMDLVAGARRVVVLMDHLDASGAPKLVKACTLPLTGAGVVDKVVTDLGVFRVDRGRGPLILVELAAGVTVEEIKARTEPTFEIALAET